MITELINSIQPFVHQEIKRVLSPYGEVLVVNNTLRLHVILLDKIKCNSSNTDLINFNSIL